MNNLMLDKLTQVVFNTFMGIVSSGKNPEMILNNMIKQNPERNIIMNQYQQSGLNPENFFVQYFKQMGVDLSPLINTVKQSNIKF